MEEQPTVQMGGSAFEQASSSQEAKTPPTIPIDDMLQQQGWPAGPPAGPQYSPPALPQQQPFSPPPVSPRPAGAGAGATRVMGPAPSAPLLAWLAVTDGPGAPRGQVFTLQPETVIGRTTGQILLTPDPFVSSQHAKIRREPSEDNPDEQVLVLYDMASANGSFVGSKEDYRESQVYRQELEDGDYVLIGETTLVFKQV